MRFSNLLPLWLREWLPNNYHDTYAAMRDGILVLNRKDSIVYMNPAAASILRKNAEAVTGQAVRQALAEYPDLLNHCCSDEALAEITLPSDGGPSFFELHATALRTRQGRLRGRLIVLHNITKRVQAQQASLENEILLKQSEETYRYLVENINEVIFTIDLEGACTYVSPATDRLDGPLSDHLLGKTYKEFVYPEDLPGVEANLKRALSGQVQSLDFRAIGRNGSLRHIRAYLRTIHKNGVPSGILGVATDVTERHLVEQALERRASQLTVLNFIGEQIAATIEIKKALDSATHLIQKHFGYYHVGIFTPDRARKDLILRSSAGAFSNLFPENHHLHFGQGMVGWAAEHKSTLRANDVRLEPRYTNLYPDRIITRSELAVPILVGDELAGVLDLQSPQIDAFDDNDVRVMKTVANQIAIAIENARLYEEVRRQLNERERQENMLRIQRDLLMRLSAAKNLEEMLRVAVESLTEELKANQAALWLVDWECHSVQPIIGAPGNQPRLPAPLDRGITGWVARNGQPALVMDMQQEKDKQGFLPDTLSLLCVPLISKSKVMGVISLESTSSNAFSQDDLRLLSTLSSSLVVLIERARLFEEVEFARRELENRAAELEEANASLRELDRLKSQFLANMSHELRTPLNSIIGFSEVLADGLVGSITGDQEGFILDILDSGRHLLKLINDLLDFSKIEAGRFTLGPTSFEIETLFEELQHTITPLIEKKGQTLSFEQKGPLPTITADPLRIKQVFLNLLSNANKFTPVGGHIVTTCRQIEQDKLLFAVNDSGIGIRPEDQALIFEEFRQVDGSLTREVPGTGLGLTISKRIVEMHGGQIWVESALHEGATFFVMLPCSCPPKPPGSH